MPKNNSLILLIVITNQFFVSPVYSQAIELTDAIRKEIIAASVLGKGGYAGECIQLRVKNKTRNPLEIKVPVGQIFESADTTEQDLMNAKEEIISLRQDLEQEVSLYTFCVEGIRSVPAANSIFKPGKKAQGPLLELAKHLAATGMYRDFSAQNAVWAITDNDRLENIGNQDIAKFVANLLGKPVPAYNIQFQPPPADRLLPGQPARWQEALALNGLFYYTLPRDQKVSFGLYDASGKLVHALFLDKLQKKGYHKFRFEFEIKGLQKGRYFARLTSGNSIIEELMVEF